MMRTIWLLPLLLVASPAWAFYQGEVVGGDLEVRGLFYASGGDLAGRRFAAGQTRLILDGDVNMGDLPLHLEYHPVFQHATNSTPRNLERTDRLNISYSGEKLQLKVGRQAINLATAFFFSPNDLFQPFAAQTLNRDFKQGVDGITATLAFGGLSQCSALLVRSGGLRPSAVVRLESALEDVSWSLLAGELNSPPQGFLPVSSQRIMGGSLQTDIGDLLGLRAEGHLSQDHAQQSHRRFAEWTVSLEHRWESGANLNVEWFQHGSRTPSLQLPYSGRNYFGMALSHELTPLLSGSLNLIQNNSDHSRLQTAQLLYSLSNESTLAIYGVQPSGRSGSEFQQYPRLISAEYQLYF